MDRLLQKAIVERYGRENYKPSTQRRKDKKIRRYGLDRTNICFKYIMDRDKERTQKSIPQEGNWEYKDNTQSLYAFFEFQTSL